jgi:hypothetical protein
MEWLYNLKNQEIHEYKYHLFREIVTHEDVVVAKIAYVKYLADPFTMILPKKDFQVSLRKD